MEEQAQPAEKELSAAEKYALFKTKDPFPTIDSALLSSADISDYVRVTGMIEPFNRINLKPVTYALVAEGPYIFWENGERKEGILKEGHRIHLKKDSILFLTLSPTIRLPNYIAARFNLTINHVYRGLLLGTGPVVDPGFEGKISIPLHNFTSNDYTILGGEKLVWMEFTKVAKNAFWGGDVDHERKGEFVEFSVKKNNRDVYDYINDADKRPIESSIPLSVTKSKDAAEAAKESVKSAENFLRLIVGINLALVITAVAMVFNVHKDTRTFYQETKATLSTESNNFNNDTKAQLIGLAHSRRVEDSLKITRLEQQIDSINTVLKKVKMK